jgi:hypothetical protein
MTIETIKAKDLTLEHLGALVQVQSRPPIRFETEDGTMTAGRLLHFQITKNTAMGWKHASLTIGELNDSETVSCGLDADIQIRRD